MLVNRSYKYAIYPNNKQKNSIINTFRCVNFIYNLMLEDKTKELKKEGKTGRQTPAQYKKLYPFLYNVDSLALCNAQLSLENAFKAYFNKTRNYPKKRDEKNYRNSYTTNHLKNNIYINDNKLIIPKIGKIKCKAHRDIPEGAIIKSVTISMNKIGKFFASVMFVYNKIETINKCKEIKVLGLDYSPTKFYIDSENRTVNYPKECYITQEKINRENSKLSSMVKDSNNWNKQMNKINRLTIKLTYQKKDFLHKLANDLSEEYDVISVEDIDIRKMSSKYNLGSYIQFYNFGMFRDILKYKMEEKGKQLLTVNKYYPSSKKCSACGYINKNLTLNDRKWECSNCHTKHERDYNAAINIRNYVYEAYDRTVGHTGIA